MGEREFDQKTQQYAFIQDALSSMPGGFMIYRADEKEEILYVNESLIEMFECDTRDQFMELTGGSFQGVVYQEDYENVKASIQLQVQAGADHYDQVNYRICTSSRKLCYVEEYGRLVDNPEYGPLYYVFVSPSQLKVDGLTGLPTRWYFLQLAKDGSSLLKDLGEKPVLLAFDLAGLRGFNSRYGMDEGDRLLVAFADILKGRIGMERCARFGEDHFYAYTRNTDLTLLLDEIIRDLHSANYGRTLSVKIGIAEYNPEAGVGTGCDQAKAAADSLNHTADSEYVHYSAQMSQNMQRRDYIVKNIERAIAEGWICIYYQPVIRTLATSVCSAEALARWDDPVQGMISPGEFVPILEDKGLSYKLDMYIVRQAVTMLQKRISQGKEVIPISVNVSRADFDACDPVSIIASICDEHNVRRNLICVEITETALMSDSDKIRQAITRFHEAGFEVWMDDFGSGYSSLNNLKDFDFDELKIDMAFLKDFNDKSKQIVTMAVRMAKSLGIHTLAEGVETEEHLAFLRDIGCERIQGYYYGRPRPLEECLDLLQKQGIHFETREDAVFYQKVGLNDMISERPYAMFFYDGEHFRTMFKNQKYSDEVTISDMTDEAAIELIMNSDQSTLSRKFRNLAEKAVATWSRATMTYAAGDRYYRFSFRPVATSPKGSMLTARIDSTVYDDQKDFKDRDMILRNIANIYDNIYLIDLVEDSRLIISSDLEGEKEGDLVYGIRDYTRSFAANIYASDQERWNRQMTDERISQMLTASGKGNFCDLYPVRKADGSYEWTEFVFIALPESRGQVFLLCTKPVGVEHQLDKNAVFSRIAGLDPETIVQNPLTSDCWTMLMQEVNLKLFWKDRDRRFLGASRSFLDYYGLASIEEIRGKTDEEIGWHIDDAPYREDERRVIEQGQPVYYAPGKNINKGITSNILASKYPIYQNGRIVGLVGYFLDIERDLGEATDLSSKLIDPVTGFLNGQGMMFNLLDFDNNLRVNGEDYCYALVEVPEYEDLVANFGEAAGQKLLQRMAECLRQTMDSSAVIGRHSGAGFVIIEKNVDLSQMRDRLELSTNLIRTIQEVPGASSLRYAGFSIVTGREADDLTKVVQMAVSRLFRSRRVSRGDYKAVTPDVFRDLPLPFVIVRPVMDAAGQVTDCSFEFANQQYCDLTGVSMKDIIGSHYLERYPRTDPKWIEVVDRASRGERQSGRLYGEAMRHWLQYIAMPSTISGACAIVFRIVGDDEREKQEQAENRAINETVIQIERRLYGETDCEKAVNNALACIGETIGADRTYLLTTDYQTMDNPYEWCRDGIASAQKDRTGRDYKYFSRWEKMLERDTSIVIDSVTILQNVAPVIYEHLHDRDIATFIVSPLYQGSKIIGYLGADNYNASGRVECRKLLESCAYFISARLQLHELMKGEKYKQTIMLAAAKTFSSEPDYPSAIHRVLDLVGEYAGADSVEIDVEDGKEERYSWGFDSHYPVHPIRVVVPLQDGLRRIGTIQMFNPTRLTEEEAKDMLMTISYFASARIMLSHNIHEN